MQENQDWPNQSLITDVRRYNEPKSRVYLDQGDIKTNIAHWITVAHQKLYQPVVGFVGGHENEHAGVEAVRPSDVAARRQLGFGEEFVEGLEGLGTEAIWNPKQKVIIPYPSHSALSEYRGNEKRLTDEGIEDLRGLGTDAIWRPKQIIIPHPWHLVTRVQGQWKKGQLKRALRVWRAYGT